MVDIWVLIAAIFASIAVTLSFIAISKHLSNFTRPHLQRYIIRILLMVPIYSMNAWFAMIVPEAGLYLDALREVYESFVIYSFMKYLLNFLQIDTNLQQYIDHKPGPSQLFPLCCLPNCIGGRGFLVRCKHGILQYVVIRPITTLIAFMSQLFGFYGEGNYNPLSGYAYPILLNINNLSQILAMYSLVIFYTGYGHELHPMNPLSKFFSIKLVVFFSFFQSVIIAGLLEIDVVEEFFRDLFPDMESKISIGRKLQEFLICIDMFIASIGHQYAFTHKPFVEDDDGESLPINDGNGRRDRLLPRGRGSNGSTEATRTCCDAFCDLFNFTDEKTDVSEHFGHIFNRIRMLFRRRLPLPDIVSTPQEQQLDDDWMNNDNIVIISNPADGDSQNPGTPELGVTKPNSSVGNYESLSNN